MPSSETSITPTFAWRDVRTQTCPPGSVNFKAFVMRLSMTWASRARSAFSSPSPSRSRAISMSLLRRSRPRSVDRLVHELLDLYRLALESDLAGFHLRDEEQIPNQSQQSVGVPFDDRDELMLLLGELAGVPFAEKLQITADRGQRRPQLMRNRGDEVVLHPVQLVEALVPGSDLPHQPRRVEREGASGRDRQCSGEDRKEKGTVARGVRAPRRLFRPHIPGWRPADFRVATTHHLGLRPVPVRGAGGAWSAFDSRSGARRRSGDILLVRGNSASHEPRLQGLADADL